MHQNEISKMTAAQFLAKVTPRSPIHFGTSADNTFHMRNAINNLRRFKTRLAELRSEVPRNEEAIATLVRRRLDESRTRFLKMDKVWADKHLRISIRPSRFADIDSFSDFVEPSTEKPFFFQPGQEVSASAKKQAEVIDTEFLERLARQESTFSTTNDRRFMTLHRGKHRSSSPNALPYQVLPFHDKDIVHSFPLTPDQVAILTDNGIGVFGRKENPDAMEKLTHIQKHGAPLLSQELMSFLPPTRFPYRHRSLSVEMARDLISKGVVVHLSLEQDMESTMSSLAPQVNNTEVPFVPGPLMDPLNPGTGEDYFTRLKRESIEHPVPPGQCKTDFRGYIARKELERGFIYIGGQKFFVNPDGTKTQVSGPDDNPSPTQVKED